jgi:hypothetical protein
MMLVASAAFFSSPAEARWSNWKYEPCCCEEEEEQVCSYGPCDCCPRLTLLQWSYGTTFSGGPAGLDEPLIGDRPDFTESPNTVGLGVTQIEMGYTYTHDEDPTTSVKSSTYPEILVRHGIFAEWLELRIGWSYAEEETITGLVRNRVSGSEDLSLGLKIGLTPQECLLPAMALIPEMTLPTGDNNLTADEVLPNLIWVYAWDVNDFLSVAGSTAGGRTIDDGSGDAYFELVQTFVMGFGLTDRIGAYTEWYGLFPHSADTAMPEHYFDGGLTFSVTNDLQLDCRAGVGLNDNADDYFIGAGMIIRH